MDSVIKRILIKFIIITVLILIYVACVFTFIVPYLVQNVYGQSAFDVPNQFNPPNQFQQQQFNQYDPYQQQQFQQPYGQQYDQFNQYQQPYQFQQYGTPQYSPYGMQPVPQQYGSQGILGFGIQEIVTALIAGGGATAYARRRTNKLEEDKQLIMAEMLRDKQKLAELARVQYKHMPQQGFEIQDAPSIRLDELNKEIDQFTDKTAKA